MTTEGGGGGPVFTQERQKARPIVSDIPHTGVETDLMRGRIETLDGLDSPGFNICESRASEVACWSP